MSNDLTNYYKKRAHQYEKIYSKPERQDDIISVTTILQNIFLNKNIIEIACGTGYWTEKISKTATSIYATDINQEVIDIAQKKEFINNNVNFGIIDIFNMKSSKKHEALFGGFIFSHVYKKDVDNFFDTINNFVKPNGIIVLMDNNFVEGSNLPITSKDADGNTFQTRLLEDQSTHLVLKNFPTENYLHEKLKNKASEINFINLKYYWILTCKVNSSLL